MADRYERCRIPDPGERVDDVVDNRDVLAVVQGFSLIGVVVGLGWLLARTGLFGRTEQEVLAKLTFWVGSPALLLLVVADADVHVLFSGFLVASAAGLVVAAGTYVALARLVLRRSWEHTIMGGMGASYVNSVNLGVPIALYVLGDAGWAAPILVMQLVVMQPAWLAALDATGGGGFRWRRLVRSPFTNPMTVGALTGLVLSVAGVDLPALVRDPIELIGGLAVPGMLLAFGISLHRAPRAHGSGAGAELVLVTVLKLAVMPAVAVLVAGPVLGLPTTETVAAGVMAALPTAQNVFILAVAYRRGEQISRDTVFITTLLSPVAVALLVLLLT